MEDGALPCPFLAVAIFGTVIIFLGLALRVPRLRSWLLTQQPESLALPVWFRPWVILPVLFALYFGVPILRCFTPHEICTLVWFLDGGADWGGGNVFTITKLAFWLSAIFGGVAAVLATYAWPGRTSGQNYFALLRRFSWHIWAALILVAVWTIPFGGVNEETTEDLLMLGGYFVVSVLLILAVVSICARCNVPKVVALALVAILGCLWGLLPVGYGRLPF